MMLKKANETLSEADHTPKYNALWTALSQAFHHRISIKIGDPDYLPQLYVSERVDAAGITELELARCLRLEHDRRGVYLLTGAAGVGKSTMIDKVTADLEAAGSLSNIVICLFRLQKGVKDPAELVAHLQVELLQRLREAIAQDPASEMQWFEYVLRNSTTPSGSSSFLLRELSSEPRAPDFWSRMDAYFAQLPLLTHLTLQLRFLRANGKEFFLIVDNVDQLAVTVQRGVLDYVVFLASGSQMIAASAAKQGGFPVLFSARHETLEVLGVPPRTTTQMIYVGRVSPPRMDRVFESRFVPLLHGFEADILQKKQSTLALLANSAIAEASARALASTWVKVVTTQRLAEYVHRLTGYNTRVTLNVLANFVASGHLEPDGLNEDHHIQKALILGPQRWYNSRTAWLHNLFADRFSDELSCVLTVWILASFEARRGKGVAAARVAERFHMALGIEIERVLERCSEIREYGLLEAAEDDGTLALSPTGKRYLQLVSSNFDYLQHVITDTPVGVEYWEPCAPSHDGLADRAGRSDKDRDEGVEARLRRVVKFTAWVNTVECRTYARAIARNRAAELRAELASESLTSRLVSALSVCMQVNRWYRFHDLQREVRAISETASFDVIEIKARALLEATER